MISVFGRYLVIGDKSLFSKPIFIRVNPDFLVINRLSTVLIESLGCEIKPGGLKYQCCGIKWEIINKMIIGEFRHVIDEKKRVSMPASFRREIGKKLVITKGLDNCLFAYTLEGWKKVLVELDKLPMTQSAARNFDRFILGSAFEVEIDSMGRILVPDHLRDFAELKSRVVIVGLSDRIEIWDERKWKDSIDKIEKQADVLAERLSEIGMF